MSQIITFYSFKGGVGRSMALANVAVLLAQWGYKVIMLDWDLEAPGLEYYFKNYIDIEKVGRENGIIDILLSSARKSNAIKWNNCVIEISIPKYENKIHFITSGKKDSDYFNRIRRFDIDYFYEHENGGDYIENLRIELKEQYDYIFIDSRTGVTDNGGICTIHLPDILNVFFTANDQSFKGAIDIANRARREQQKLPFDRQKLIALPIPSRFDSSPEFKISQEWLNLFAEGLKPFYEDWLPKDTNIREFLEIIKIPYIAYFSFGEKLPVIEHGVNDPASIGYAYETITALISHNLEDVDILKDNRDMYIKQANKKSLNLQGIKIFVSYVNEDRNIVEAFCLKLINEGVSIIKNEYNFPDEDKWDDSILKKINESDFFLMCLSKNSINTKSKYFKEEKFNAFNIENKMQRDIIFIIPLNIDNSNINNIIKKTRIKKFFNIFEEIEKNKIEVFNEFIRGEYLKKKKILLIEEATVKDKALIKFEKVSGRDIVLDKFEKRYNTSNLKIFISYAHEDQQKVEKLYLLLQKKGYELWMDTYNLKPVENWTPVILKAIREHDFFLACLSHFSINHIGYVQSEWKMAREVAKMYPSKFNFLYPVMLENCQIPPEFNQIHIIDLFDDKNGVILSHFESLCKAIEREFEERKKVEKKRKSDITHSKIFTAALKFIDREHEKEIVVNPGAPDLLVINAPTGYGKTRLLQEIQKWYQENHSQDWICVQLSLNKPEYKVEPRLIIDDIYKEIIQTNEQIFEVDVLIQELLPQNKHMIFMFDDADANKNAVDFLNEEFINKLKSALENVNVVARFIFTGRYLRRMEPEKWEWSNFKFFDLTVLEESIVNLSLEEELKNYNLQYKTKAVVAHEITELSAGHPGIINNIIIHYPMGRWALVIKNNQLMHEERQKIFHQYAVPIINDILLELKDEVYKNILEILSIFRKFNLNHIMALKFLSEGVFFSQDVSNTLNDLASRVSFNEILSPFGKTKNNPITILTHLVRTGLVSGPTSERPFYHDAIIRKLILLKMKFDDGKVLYNHLNKLANVIYDTWIQGNNIDSAPLPIPPADAIQIEYMTESFYYFLICLSHDKNKNSEHVIDQKIKWYLTLLRSSFYPRDWMQQTLFNTLQSDEDIPKLLDELLGEEKKKEIFNKIISQE